MTTVLRPTETSDYDGVVACLRRSNMDTWSRERWLSLWDDHPHRQDFQNVPRGYVLEVDGVIVGSVSSVWAKYCLENRELRALFGASVAVDPEHRGGSIKLIGKQLLDPGIDLYLNGSASAATSKIMDVMKVARVPQPDNDLMLLWAVNGRRAALAGLRRRGVPLAAGVAWPVGLGLVAVSRFALRRGGRASYPVDEVATIADEFDHLWQAIRSTSQKLIQFRDAATLRWRFGPKLASRDAVVVTVRRTGQLAGYAVLVRTPRPALGLVCNTIQDFQCVDDDPALVTSLLGAAWDATRSAKLDLLEWAGFTGEKRAIAERRSKLRYRLDVWQAFYYTRDPALKKELPKPDRWDFSLYDSD